MILIADSGSTKTDWRLIEDGKELKQITTPGFNPMLQNESEILNQIHTQLRPQLSASVDEKKIKNLRIYYYGAGCSNASRKAIVHSALKIIFPGSYIEVDHDLLAAARGICGKEKGMAAILGTGSNSCIFDGKYITANILSLGYILGDEGSGAHIGKHFIKEYLTGQLPEDLSKDFYSQYKMEKEQILDAIYKQPMPSRFLASFSRFISTKKENDYFQKLIHTCFREFFHAQICKYPEHKEYPLNCIGSVAFIYKDILEAVAKEHDVQLNKVLVSPMQGLINFHTKTNSIQA